MTEQQLFASERVLPRADIVDELAAAAADLEDGTVRLATDDGTLDIEVPEEATFEVELERQSGGDGGDDYELEFELSWTE